MLSGIKTGKKKKRKMTEEPSNEASAPNKQPRHSTQEHSRNVSAAQQLKEQLTSGIIPASQSSSVEARLSETTTDDTSYKEKKGANVVVLTGAAVGTMSNRPEYRPEDFRHGSRKGKLKRDNVAGTTQDEASLSIQDLIRQEQTQTQSMDEVYARNVFRIGSRYKASDFHCGSKTGADEDDQHVDMTLFSQQRNLTTVALQQRERSRQVAQHDQEQSLVKQFWWWVESPSFPKHTLLALGNHVSMVMVPSHLSLTPGTHVYLVPIKHADAFVNCEDDVWNEIAHFQIALRAMYAKEGKDVLFVETVLPSKGLWQTRMEAIPVPKRAAQDAPLYFKSALTEQAQEWGTHTKLLSTRDKGLRRTIPKKFPYFFVEWAPGEGYAQIIETSDFPKDFGADTIAGMMQMDPLRFRARKKTSKEEERQQILGFVDKWKPFDWTLELD